MATMKLSKSRKGMAWQYLLAIILGLILLLVAIIIIGKSTTTSSGIIDKIRQIF